MSLRLRSLPMLLSLGALALSFPMAVSAQATDCAAGEQAFTHALGTACVPENVERVITLEWSYTEDLLALGLQPVGAADIA